MEEIDDGPGGDKSKPKKKKWKLQSRNVEVKMGTNERLIKLKRPGCSMEWENPKTKRSKTNSPKKNGYSPRDQKKKAAATKLICENEFGEVSKKIQNVINRISAEVARQPRREQ